MTRKKKLKKDFRRIKFQQTLAYILQNNSALTVTWNRIAGVDKNTDADAKYN